MKLFGKKTEPEPEIPSKTIKDLKPENRRKRKEPPKPWGKLERFLIILFFGGTVIMSGFLALKARAWRLPGMPRVKIPTLEDGTVVIEKEESGKTSDSLTVIEEFKSKTAGLSGVYGFKVIRLQGGEYGLYENEIFTAASLIKLPVIIALYKEAEDGNINLDSEYSIKAQDKAPGSGSLYSKPVGTSVTIRDLARAMGKESDNTAYRAAKSILGDEKINDLIASLGMTETSLDSNDTSPDDIARLFEKLWRGEIVSKKSRDEIISYLTNTIYEDRIPAGIPLDVQVAHKVGTEVAAISDGGIVFSDKPYIVVIMTKGVIESEAIDIFPTLSEIIYEHELSY